MSGKIVRKIISRLLRRLLAIIISWCICVPIAYIIPKKKNLVVFIGQNGGNLTGNVKYLFFHIYKLRQENVELCFFTGKKEVYEELKQNNIPVLFHTSIWSLFKLLQANVVVVDSNMSQGKYYLAFCSYIVQLWHGIGFKRIAEDNINEIKAIKSMMLKKFYKKLHFYPRHDLLVSTSPFYTENVFAPALRHRQVLEAGYPRNDVMFREPDEFDMLGADATCIARVEQLRDKGYKIIVWAPTFRDSGGGLLEDNALDVEKMVAFTKQYKLAIIFKFHPSNRGNKQLEGMDTIIQYDRHKDIYPLFRLADMMITDYSSIYMDYLLLNKPVLFFAYDYQKYVERDRDIQFDYNWITPGHKCYTQDELHAEIVQIINGNDRYKEHRNEILEIAFKHKDGQASERVWSFIANNYLGNESMARNATNSKYHDIKS